jgi:hypothetical protein
MSEIPESGIIATREGNVLRLLFGFEKKEKTEDNDIDSYQCESVDVAGATSYGSIISAIVNDKYSNDDVQAIIANYEEAKDVENPSEKEQEHLDEYKEYQEYRQRAKEIAKVVVAMEV